MKLYKFNFFSRRNDCCFFRKHILRHFNKNRPMGFETLAFFFITFRKCHETNQNYNYPCEIQMGKKICKLDLCVRISGLQNVCLSGQFFEALDRQRLKAATNLFRKAVLLNSLTPPPPFFFFPRAYNFLFNWS